jgi:hypothetical protein
VPSIRFDDVRDRPVRRKTPILPISLRLKRQRLQTSFNPIQVLGGPKNSRGDHDKAATAPA